MLRTRCLVAFTLGVALTGCKTTGSSADAAVKVVGGEEVVPGEFTAVVRVLPTGRVKDGSCGGTFVKASWYPGDLLLTAAHCIVNDDRKPYKGFVAVDPFDEGNKATPVGYYVHPSYPDEEEYDFAAVLFEAGTAESLGVKKKKLFSAQPAEAGDRIAVVSFGPPDATGKCSAGHGVKRYGFATVDEADGTYIDWTATPPFDVENAATEVCDSGGALLETQDGKLVGIVHAGWLTDGGDKVQHHLSVSSDSFLEFWKGLQEEGVGGQ